jgi:hypothetical protein
VSEAMGNIEALSAAERGATPPAFEEAVEAFCIEMARIRARLALAGVGGDGGPRDGPIRGRGAHRTDRKSVV